MSQLYENLRQLITVVDELRDVGLQNYISLPRIAAIGTQSSGKSSAIESLVGLDFLPRGGGVVTRRPLELRLVHLSNLDEKEEQAWAVFDHHPDKKFHDFNEVRAEIERLTDEVAGKNKGIVNDPIVMTVYSTSAPDLTVIDLPGITRVPVKGSDQTEDIEKVTRDMSMHYAKDPRTIILAVIPANQDMSVSDALKMAREVDPNGHRTIGVITKIDIMDQGVDATRMLRGEDVSLHLGYVGVKMRSQQDILDNKSVKQALKDEKEWFENHRQYSKLPPGLVGTSVLVDKLTQVLLKHIRRFLPEIKKEIGQRRQKVEMRIQELGEGVPMVEAERKQLMWTMISDYCDMFTNTIRGKYDRKLQRYMASLPAGSNTESGGAKIREIMNDFLVEYMQQGITADMSNGDIDKALHMHEGDSLPGFPSPDTFEFLALPHLQKITIPSLECVDSVSSALDHTAGRVAHAVLRRFPTLRDGVMEMTQRIIERERDNTRAIVEQQVACHIGYLFTNDPSYLIDHGSMEPMYERQATAPTVKEEPKDPGVMEKTMQQVKGSSKAAYDKMNTMVKGEQPRRRPHQYSGPFVDEIRARLDAYFAIIIRNIRDCVPRAIGFYLVRFVQDKLQYELLNEFADDARISELLGEPPHIIEERKQLASQLTVLQKASSVLTRDPTLAAIAMEAEMEEEVQEEAAHQRGSMPGRATSGRALLSNVSAAASNVGASASAAAAQAASRAAAAAASAASASPFRGGSSPASTASAPSAPAAQPAKDLMATAASTASSAALRQASASSLFGTAAAGPLGTAKKGLFDDT
mmetsp:Transcript_4410/g.10199  ORF Transcript_4410/g.10199 Transcript_4410/m.10199 type:complete len:808 (-) Transcript_4410:35-2458(-)